ncbi:hypothetical protein BGZ68_006569 [Mortierella alpina]|nr:hypothetical protein BGZ68_006569 [Mortierella alpina]
MLQSSYLPIPQFLSSRRTGFKGAAASSKSSDRNTAEAEGDTTQKSSSTPALSTRSPSLRSVSTPTSTPVVTAAPSPAADPYFEADPHSSGTLKTAHGQAPPASSSSASSSSSPFRTHRRKPSSREYFNTPHQICSQLSNVLLHHVELMLDSYPNWCTVAAKVNHAITAALRVSCLNARLSSSSGPAREEARAGFKMGTDLYKRLAHLPGPLTIRDWPVEEDIQLMMDIEEEFREMMMTQEEQDEASFSSTSGEATEGASGAAVETEGAQGADQPPPTTRSETVGEASDGRRSPQHLFGLGEEEDYKFEFHPDPLL